MDGWPKFAAVGAIGPDLFFWLMDFHDPRFPGDEVMLAFSLLYYLDDKGFFDDFWQALLTILSEELPDPWGKFFHVILKLYIIWKDFVKIWNDTIGTIIEQAGQIIDDALGGLLTSLGDALTQLVNALVALLVEEVVTSFDVFAPFSLKMRQGFDEQAFLWSDMAHYRRTSAIPERLIFHARALLRKEDDLEKEHGLQLLAFALGWVCHVGTDVVAHSFINEQCGGPFRTHWQRHHLLENHIDAWVYECTKENGVLPADPFVGWQESYDSLAESALYFAVQIPQNIDRLTDEKKQGVLRQPLPEGENKETHEERKKLLDTDGALPPWFAETITKVLIEIYADPKEGGEEDYQRRLQDGGTMPHPKNLAGQTFHDQLKKDTRLIEKWLGKFGVGDVGVSLEELRQIITPDPKDIQSVPEGFPMPWQIMATYRFMLSWLKRSYLSTFALDRPEPPSIFTPPASDFDFPPPPDFDGIDPNDDPVSQTCETIAALLDWVVKTVHKVAQICYDLAKTVASATTFLLRDAIYHLLTLPLWTAAENIRMVLVHLGLFMPQSEKREDGRLIRPNEIDEVLITLGHSVDDAFRAALEDAMDPFGNLDKDEDLIHQPTREVLGAPNPWLPVREVNGTHVVEFQRPWAFPNQNNSRDPKANSNFLETPLTIAGPYLINTKPHSLLDTDKSASNDVRKAYEDAQCPDETDGINLEHIFVGREGNPLGDPVVFSAYLIGQIAHNPSFISSFNLDADRGFGYLCWDWERDEATSLPVDQRNHTFKPPKTWPEGTADEMGKWTKPPPAGLGPTPNQDTTELNIHYPGRSCV